MRRLMAWIIALLPIGATGDPAGDFDYFVLSLSWSPNWCALTGNARGAEQCGQDHGWILHGLWPQYENGYPEFCPTSRPAPSRSATRAMADIMGSSGLAWHQWKKHGTCTGLDGADYLALSRAAFGRIERPQVLRRLGETVRIAPGVVEAAFLQANSDLAPDRITITCRADHIQEARICLTKDLVPRRCGADVVTDCTAPSALLTPVR